MAKEGKNYILQVLLPPDAYMFKPNDKYLLFYKSIIRFK